MCKEGEFNGSLWSDAIARSIVFFFCVCELVWRSVACSVYGALGWDPCGVSYVTSVYEAFGLAFSFS